MAEDTTACKWDTIIPFEPLWQVYKRIIKKNGAIVLTASQPFTSQLVMSNPKWFKYEWIWNKVKPASGLSAYNMPLRITENILVFGEDIYYHPIMTNKQRRAENKCDSNGEAFGGARVKRHHDNNGLGYPQNIIEISNANQNDREHPTQKPVPLFSYLIRTYTNEGDTVLDNCAGSGTTAVAAINTNRNFVLIEQDPDYCDIANRRIKEAQAQLRMELVV